MTGWCGYVGYGAGLSEDMPETTEEENGKTDDAGRRKERVVSIFTVKTIYSADTLHHTVRWVTDPSKPEAPLHKLPFASLCYLKLTPNQ